MAKVGIITDTVACLPPELIKEYNIGIIPISMQINGQSYLDQVDINNDKFWGMFNDIKEFLTAAPSQVLFTEKFQEMSRWTDNIVCTFVSRELSATYESAVQARDAFVRENANVKIEIVDSKSAGGAQGFIALEMARAAAREKTLDEVIRVGQDMVNRVKFIFAMETLKYIIKSGRAPKTAYMGEIFQVKPILGLGITNHSGLVENLSRVRGKQAALKKLPEMIKDYIDVTKPVHIIIHYTNDIAIGKQLQELVTAQYQCAEIYLTPYSVVMTGHTGPVFAIGFYQ